MILHNFSVDLISFILNIIRRKILIGREDKSIKEFTTSPDENLTHRTKLFKYDCALFCGWNISIDIDCSVLFLNTNLAFIIFLENLGS